jgi:hypothetical protein
MAQVVECLPSKFNPQCYHFPFKKKELFFLTYMGDIISSQRGFLIFHPWKALAFSVRIISHTSYQNFLPPNSFSCFGFSTPEPSLLVKGWSFVSDAPLMLACINHGPTPPLPVSPDNAVRDRKL